MNDHWPDSKAFWTNKRVVVTGGTGFLGSFVSEKLRLRGAAAVFAVGSQDYDLRRREAVQQMLADTRPEIIIHLAAKVGGIGVNQARPAEFFYDNLVMGADLLHESWRAGVEKFVAIGTICAYPKYTPLPFKEENLWNGYPEETNAPYGIAKKMLLVQAQAYRQQYDFNAIYLLPVNLYGPRDNFDLETSHVIPALIRKFIEAQDQLDKPTVTVWGDGSPTREFLYVEDCAEAILLATERYNKPEPINIGAGFEISIKDLVYLIADLTGYRGEIFWDTSKPGGQPRRSLNIERARREFGFEAKVGFREGLQRTIQWYLEHRGQV